MCRSKRDGRIVVFLAIPPFDGAEAAAAVPFTFGAAAPVDAAVVVIFVVIATGAAAALPCAGMFPL